LKNEIKSPVQAKQFQSAIRRFCRMNKIKGIDWDFLHEFKGRKGNKTKYGQDKDDAYTHDQINKLLSICDSRQRCIVLIYASTGIRLAALPPMKLRDIQTVPGKDFFKFTVYPNDEEYDTYCTPECKAAILDYLAFRERIGLERGLIEGIGVSDAPLIREEFDTVNPISKKPRHINHATIQWALSQLFARVGIREIGHKEGAWRDRKPIKLVHGFRKFFRTQLLQSDVKELIATMLMGHDAKLGGVYSRPKELVVSEYEKAIPNLTINNEARLEGQLEKERADKSEIEQLKNRLELLEQRRLQENLDHLEKAHESEKNRVELLEELLKMTKDEFHKLMGRYPTREEIERYKPVKNKK
jgi:integrase